jgi:hypothetical protein
MSARAITRTNDRTSPAPPTRRQDYEVLLHGLLRDNNRYIRTMTNQVSNLRQRKRLYGGWWSASWDAANMTAQQMTDFFNQRVGYHIQIVSGHGKAWQGFIWEIEITYRGVVRRISMADVANSVKCIYVDQSDDTRKATSFYQDTDSIDRYSEIQEIVYLDHVTTATAEAYAQTVLAENAWPKAEVVSVLGADAVNAMTVEAVGYVYTMNYQYITITEGSDTITNHISDVLSTNCPDVIEGTIDTNATTVDIPDTEVRAWDWLLQLAEIGDGTDPYFIEVTDGRRVNYKALSSSPTIYWRDGTVRRTMGTPTAVNKWQLEPGIMRDLEWPERTTSPSAFLDDGRDSIVTEIEAAERADMPILKTERFDESDFMAGLAKELR